MAKVLDGTAAWTVGGAKNQQDIIHGDKCRPVVTLWNCGTHRTFWCSKVDDIAIGLEHVDFLNSLDRLDIKLLECGLQLLVIHSCALVDLLDLSSRCALSTVRSLSVC